MSLLASATDVLMPRLSDSMEEGTIVRWLVDDGATVVAGQEIVEIETDKATMVHEAEAAGVLVVVAQEGDTVALGEPIARLAPIGGSNGAAPASGARTPASPVARRIARERGVDLAAVTGSGRGGRITRADVEAAVAPPAPEPVAPPAPPAASAAAPPAAATAAPSQAARAPKGATELFELSRMQKTIARRMAEAKATVPEFTLSRTVAMDAAVTLRTMVGDAPLPSYNDMVVRACGLALRAVPRANGTYRDERFELHERVNVGIAVAADDALLVPTIFDADIRSLGSIARTARRLAARCRDGVVTAAELAGGTFAVSNLGMLGVDRFTAVINPPHAAILAVGALRSQAVVRDGELAVGQTMELTLTCDHRILYGAQAAELLGLIAGHLESPASLLL
ncbi:MAG TPA: dihydrolipoamide acetyltransferase family protein [Baekduia sp.]|uniref:dihydrolipoamide acetyltransferase family protein n=1 Tax=Baekduia sp. TaxID=2600305 RepID=UPI002D1D87E4|nr:dihydrolipoamide acetyltransferase family protein [Baekduia sp.]HMJ34247.1 dihydrolipoamide acetyltransferase family protein [Baekduia sp.]